jgi:hypothetical protein
MRILKTLVLGILAIFIALVAVAYILPREVTVERSVVIAAPPADIFPHVNSLKANEAWSPWMDRDPGMVTVYEGPESGVGNKLTWTSNNPNVGNGSNIITASDPDRRVDTALDFGSMGTANAWIVLDPMGDETQVSWGFTTDMGMNPMARWMGLMMDEWVGADYEDGLNRLKALVEAG